MCESLSVISYICSHQGDIRPVCVCVNQCVCVCVCVNHSVLYLISVHIKVILDQCVCVCVCVCESISVLSYICSNQSDIRPVCVGSD